MSKTISTTHLRFVWCAATIALCGWSSTARAATFHINRSSSIDLNQVNIDANIVNAGLLRVTGSTNVNGSLAIAVDAQTIVKPAQPCCNMAFDVAGPISNAGTFSIASSYFDRDVTVRLGAGQGFTNEATGTLTGNGIIDGNVVNHGVVRPGSPDGLVATPIGIGDPVLLPDYYGVTTSFIGPPRDGFAPVWWPGPELLIPSGAMKVSDNYRQDPDGTLEFEISWMTALTNFGSRLDVGGVVDLNGRMELSLAEGFVPQAGDSFELITAVGGVPGRFAETILPDLPNGMYWNVIYGPSDVSIIAPLRGVPEPAPAALILLGYSGLLISGGRRRHRFRPARLHNQNRRIDSIAYLRPKN